MTVYRHEVEISTKAENMDAVMAFIETHTEGLGDPKLSRQLQLVGEELAVNVFSYAYAGGEGYFNLRICLYPEDRRVVMEFRDKGMPYNPLTRETPDTTVPISERPIGGLGVMLSIKMTDSQNYLRRSGYNILTVTKQY